MSVEPHDQMYGLSDSADPGPKRARVVLQELQRILNSRFFKNATRSRQFLEFVVSRKLEGKAERLKERTIGTELFQRAPGYATGDDPVVRVQAGEVRRRLEQFYRANGSDIPVRIELPLGSYSPNFLWTAVDSGTQPESRFQKLSREPRKSSPYRTSVLFSLAIASLVLAGLFYLRHPSTSPKQESRIEQFWGPVLVTPQPVLICLAKPVVYRPTAELYRRYSDKHAGTFGTEVERSNELLPLRPDDRLTWSELMDYPDYGVAVGDVYAAVQLSGLLGKLGKPSQVRIGANYSFEDLRNSPSVLVGAFNNKWTMQVSPNLHFTFIEEGEQFFLREQTPSGRTWHARLSPGQQSGDDYAIVARLLDSNTGQFTIITAGLTGSGTQTAGEFVSRPDFLEKALASAPSDWQKKNMEIVLQTSVTDSIAGPPKVVAAYYW